ncbi:class I SAM-dependent methyltransferase, partial [Rossellomorea marisflavi]|uniref:class I SAM-dependent methyltransferase n=1 Tax=Rossellomorea marisflavi TaxID=189381 RepID=UPI0037CC906F
MNQTDMSQINETGWNRRAYDAWVNRHGVPAEYAEKIKHDPRKSVEHYLNYMNGIKGRKIVNLLGSKGNKAVSFALLGAEVTVVDLSRDNARYASELAEAAGVKVTYIVSDVLDIPETQKIS